MTAEFQVIVFICFFVAITGCEGDFDDRRQSLLKKPELLSMVLEPAEAGPGEKVTASFVLADAKGVLPARGQVWLPGDIAAADPAGSGLSSAWLGQVKQSLPGLGLSWGELWGRQLDLVAPKLVGDGRGNTVTLSLVVQVGGACAGADAEAVLLSDLAQNLTCDAVRLGVRTLLVSDRAARNRNPEVVSVALVHGGSRTEARLVTAGTSDPTAARQLAADAPLTVPAGAEVTLEAKATDPDGQSLTYQWISPGGDLGGYRRARQPWTAPSHRKPGSGEKDQSGGTNVDPRTDPNLYPVWLILRDQGDVSAVAGQTWAELYVRVVPVKSSKNR